jgi:HK97 gp10 family phage protein
MAGASLNCCSCVAAMINMKIEGLAELQKALNELPQELHKGPLRSAVSAAAKVVQDEAKNNAPVDTGVLRKAIYRTRSKSGSSAVQETAIVGVRYGRKYRKRGMDAWYWRFKEFGTAKMAATPFMRPAFDTTKEQQIEAMKTRLARAIQRAAKKLARQKK